MNARYCLTPALLFAAIAGPRPPLLLDVRRRALVVESGRLLPASRTADADDAPALAAWLDRDRSVVVACAHGHNRSQRLAAELRERGFSACILEGGFDEWVAAGLPTVRREARSVTLGDAPTLWVTRRRPKIDRVACPWLITRYLDPEARFLFVEPEGVLAVAADAGGIAFDLPGAPFEHEGEGCTFDTLLAAFGLGDDPGLAALAAIVRAADTDRLGDDPRAAGLLAISLGLSARHGDDDRAVLREAIPVYDGLIAWARHAQAERHHWPRPTA